MNSSLLSFGEKKIFVIVGVFLNKNRRCPGVGNNILILYHLAYFSIKTFPFPQHMLGIILLSLPFQ